MRLRKAVPLLILALTLQGFALPLVYGSTSSATPKSTPKSKPEITEVKKVTTVKKVVAKQGAPKKVTHKKVVIIRKSVAATKTKVVTRKYTYRAPIRKEVKPSPAPMWPPKGFTSVGTAYARVPTGTELIGILSALKKPNTAINVCAADPINPNAKAYSCAAILVGSSQRCTWWKVSSTITGVDPANLQNRMDLGVITTVVGGAPAKSIQTIFLISPVPLATGVKFIALHALCGIVSTMDSIPSTTFIPTPTQSPSQSPTPSDSPTPTNP